MSDVDAATDLVVLFKVLGSDTRLRLLHALHRGGEVAVGELAEQVGMRPQAVSNQLQRLADRGIVTARRDGNRILYSIADACVPAVLDLALFDRRDVGVGMTASATSGSSTALAAETLRGSAVTSHSDQSTGRSLHDHHTRHQRRPGPTAGADPGSLRQRRPGRHHEGNRQRLLR